MPDFHDTPGGGYSVRVLVHTREDGTVLVELDGLLTWLETYGDAEFREPPALHAAIDYLRCLQISTSTDYAAQAQQLAQPTPVDSVKCPYCGTLWSTDG